MIVPQAEESNVSSIWCCALLQILRKNIYHESTFFFFFFFRKSWQILETVQTLTVTRGPMQADNTTVMVAEGWPLLSVASRVQRCDTNQTPSPNGKKQHFGRHEVATELRSFLNRSMSALHKGVKSLLLLPIVTPLIRWSVFLVDATNKRNAWRNKLLN